MPDTLQPSFSRGELTPAAHGRVDTAMYQIAVKTGRNAFVHVEGGISNRPGLKWVGPVKDHTYSPRLIPFRFKADDQYVLEFGDEYMRVIREAGYVLNNDQVNITSITKENPVEVTAAGHTFSNGDDIFISSVSGMVEINNRWFTVAGVTGDGFTLQDQATGTNIDGTSYTTYTSGGVVSSVYELTTPYDKDDLFELKYVQLADTITITHKNYKPQELKRISDNSWTIEEIKTVPDNNFPTSLSVTSETTATSNLARNGKFDSDLHWIRGPGWTISGGVATHVATGTEDVIIQNIAFGDVAGLIKGQEYTLTYTLTVTAGNITPVVGNTDGIERDAGGTYSEPIAADNDDHIQFRASTDFAGTIDDVVLLIGKSKTYKYRVTALTQDTLEESLPAVATETFNIGNITQASPAVITTTTNHTIANGEEVALANITGMTELNGRRFKAANVTDTTLELVGSDSTNYSAYIGSGTLNKTFVEIEAAETDLKNTITWAAVSDAAQYVVYKNENGLYGFIGETEDTTFVDDNIVPDFAQTPPKFRDPFDTVNSYPGATSYWEQRRVFGGSIDKPDTSYYSVIGSPSNFSSSSPAKADDAITATLNALEINEIRHYIPGNDLLILTAGSEWRINSGGEASFETSTIRQKHQSNYGADHTRPLVIGNTVLFVEERKNKIRSLGYSFQTDSYQSTDLSVLATHLLVDHEVVDWDYANSPFSIIHIVRDDGKSLALTFNEEHQVIAWTVWETQGEFESVCTTRTLPADTHDEAYFVVKRTVGGNTVRYVERTWSRLFSEPEEAYFVDGGACFPQGFNTSSFSSSEANANTLATSGLTPITLAQLDANSLLCIGHGIWWSSEKGLFVAVGTEGSDATPTPAIGAMIISRDGKTWLNIEDTNVTSVVWNDVTYSPSLGLFVAVGDGDAAWSTDGVTWDFTTTVITGGDSIVWSEEQGIFVVGATSTIIYTSTDGKNWTLRDITALGLTRDLLGGTYAPGLNGTGMFILGHGNFTASGKIISSYDGITWTDRGDPSGGTARGYQDAAWSPTLERFVISANDATGVGAYWSDDGISWTAGTGLTAGVSYDGVVWASGLGKFFIVTNSNTGDPYSIASSPDGKVWTEFTDSTIENRLLRDIAYAPELGDNGRLVTGDSIRPPTTEGSIMWSDDGTNWFNGTPNS